MLDILKQKNKLRLELSNDIINALNEASIVAITDNTGIIIYTNEKFCEISKYSEEELLGKNHRILKSGFHPPEFYSDMWRTISNGTSWHGDVKNKAKDGTFYWMRTTIMPTFDEKQNIQHYISIRTDITSQIELSEKLHKAERMATIGELSGRIVHDIRNPLSVIGMSLENLKIKYGTNNPKEDQFDKIERSIDRINYQINEILDFIRERPVEMSKEKISEIIFESLDSMIVPDNIELILPKNDTELFCNKKQFSLVITNLISNGIQAIDGTGTIEVTVEKNNDAIVIQVKDSGSGINSRDIDKIFDPLFSTKQKGTGLGLASVQAIVDAHGGIISVTSPPTIFTITLPQTLE
jgi:PAS domain S-box-containing protein